MSGETPSNAVYAVDTYNHTIHTTAHSVRAAASDVDHVGAVLYSTAPQGIDGYNATLTGDKAATLGVNCGMSSGRNGVLVHKSTSCAEVETVVLDSIGGQAESARATQTAPTLKASHYKFPPCVMEQRGDHT